MHPASDRIGFDVQAMRPGIVQNITTSGTSAQSSALNSETRVVRLIATTNTYVAFGSNPTATSSSMYLTASSSEYFIVAGGSKIAALQVGDSGILNITEMC